MHELFPKVLRLHLYNLETEEQLNHTIDKVAQSYLAGHPRVLILPTADQTLLQALLNGLSQRGIAAQHSHCPTPETIAALKYTDQLLVITGDPHMPGFGAWGDIFAVSVAAVLGFPCTLFTKYLGFYSVDPAVYPDAVILPALTYEEALEMASKGARYVETLAVEVAHHHKVPLTITHFAKENTGSQIKEVDPLMENKAVTALTIDEDVLMVSMNLVPFASSNVAQIFSKLASQGIVVDMISQTAPYNSFVNISFTSCSKDKLAIKQILEEICTRFPTIDYLIDDEITKITVVGSGMITASGVAARLFRLFADNHVDFYQVTTSEISISYTVNPYDRDKITHLIAEAFEL